MTSPAKPQGTSVAPLAHDGSDAWVTLELTADSYLMAVFKPRADEPDARPIVRVCAAESDRVDELFMLSTSMTGLYVLDLKPDGNSCVPTLRTVVKVARCQVPERSDRLVTMLTTACGLNLWVPGEGTLETLKPIYLICNFKDPTALA